MVKVAGQDVDTQEPWMWRSVWLSLQLRKRARPTAPLLLPLSSLSPPLAEADNKPRAALAISGGIL